MKFISRRFRRHPLNILETLRGSAQSAGDSPIQKMLSQIGIAITTFIVTNIDDLLILSFYFASPQYKVKNIVIGQYLGIITLTAISFLGLILGFFLESHWISLLGIIPFGIGLKDFIQLFKKEKEESPQFPSKKSSVQFLSVAPVTIANGGDNIGVYTPLFANLDLSYVPVYVVVFLLLTATWCILAYYPGET